MNLKIYFLILIFQLAITFPNFYKTCQKLDAERLVIYILHHLSDIFVFWGPLFLETRQEFLIHMLFAVGVATHWATYKNRCIATVYMNRLCGYDEDMWLDAIQNRLGLREKNEYFQTIWMALVVLYDIYQMGY